MYRIENVHEISNGITICNVNIQEMINFRDILLNWMKNGMITIKIYSKEQDRNILKSLVNKPQQYRGRSRSRNKRFNLPKNGKANDPEEIYGKQTNF